MYGQMLGGGWKTQTLRSNGTLVWRVGLLFLQNSIWCQSEKPSKMVDYQIQRHQDVITFRRAKSKRVNVFRIHFLNVLKLFSIIIYYKIQNVEFPKNVTFTTRPLLWEIQVVWLPVNDMVEWPYLNYIQFEKNITFY